jgi:hypothetical protein
MFDSSWKNHDPFSSMRKELEHQALLSDLAVRALHDLRALGVSIELIPGVSPAVLETVDRYDRETEAFS